MQNRKGKKEEEIKGISKILKHTSKHMAEDDQESSKCLSFLIFSNDDKQQKGAFPILQRSQ